MQSVTIITDDPIIDKLLQYMVAELPEPAEDLVLLDAAQMERTPEFSGSRVVLFSDSADPGYLEPARKSGAAAFWYLEPSVESLSRVLAGKPAFPENAPEIQLGNAKSSGLTPREMDVLRQLVSGRSDAEIAQNLSCSVPTVKHHIQQLRIKSGFSNRTQMAVAAVKAGLADHGYENYTFG